MSRLMAAVVRLRVPMLPRPPKFDTHAANSADVAEPMGARMIGTSIPSNSQRAVLSMTPALDRSKNALYTGYRFTGLLMLLGNTSRQSGIELSPPLLAIADKTH